MSVSSQRVNHIRFQRTSILIIEQLRSRGMASEVVTFLGSHKGGFNDITRRMQIKKQLCSLVINLKKFEIKSL
jgi:hypothetical protein